MNKNKGKPLPLTQGSNNANAKLTEASILIIRGMIEQGWNNKEIAWRFKVTASVISQIRHKKRWKHVI